MNYLLGCFRCLPPAGAAANAIVTSVSFFERASRPRVFAHRGGCAIGPENTVSAFERGLTAGADGLDAYRIIAANAAGRAVHVRASFEKATRG